MEAYQEETIDAGQNNEHKISRLPTGKADTCRKPLGYLIGSRGSQLRKIVEPRKLNYRLRHETQFVQVARQSSRTFDSIGPKEKKLLKQLGKKGNHFFPTVISIGQESRGCSTDGQRCLDYQQFKDER